MFVLFLFCYWSTEGRQNCIPKGSWQYFYLHFFFNLLFIVVFNRWSMFFKNNIIYTFILNYPVVYLFFYCPYTLVVRCGRVSGIQHISWYGISVSRDYITLPYLTIRHAQTVGVKQATIIQMRFAYTLRLKLQQKKVHFCYGLAKVVLNMPA